MKKLLLLCLLCCNALLADESNVLENASIYLDYNNATYETIQKKSFTPFSSKHINYGFNASLSVWVKFSIDNDTNFVKNSVLEVNNPLLEHVIFYDENNHSTQTGILHIHKNQKHINPHIHITLPPHSSKYYLLHVKNSTTALQFSLLKLNEKSFIHKDTIRQFSIILFMGIISAFLLYSLALYFYSRDSSYMYYAIYIATLLFQQLTYVGFLPLYMPQSFTHIDNLIVVPKVGAVIITAILFARSFLKVSLYKHLDFIYKVIIYAVIVQILLFSTPYFYLPEITILTGLLFIFFNLYVGIYVYKRGNKQARFFIAGWSILIIGYFLTIIDALGIYSIMYYFPQLLMVSTIFEALFLLLAFVDKLNILQNQKDVADSALVEELTFRNELVEKEVESRTNALHLLYRELHHRVKNNLQIILSIIRLQGDKMDDIETKEAFSQLEGRINSIAKTHELLYQNEKQEDIDMYEYISSLIEDIKASRPPSDIDISITCTIHMALKEAVYVGLIINELISNAFKHAQCDTILLQLTNENSDYHLHVEDNGIGFTHETIHTKALGLKLVKTLINNQLNGKIETNTNGTSSYDIRFSI